MSRSRFPIKFVPPCLWKPSRPQYRQSCYPICPIVEQGTQKRSVIGIFDRLGFPQFPATYGMICITVWLTNIEGTMSELEVTARIELSDSAHVIFSSSVKLGFEERRFQRDGVIGLTIPAVNVAFPNPGKYTVKILLNGQDAGSARF